MELTLSASEGAGSGVDYMSLSEDGQGWTYEPYAATDAFTLSAANGVKTVSVKFYDDVGNESAVYSKSIVLDTVNPSVMSVLPSPGGRAPRTTNAVAYFPGEESLDPATINPTNFYLRIKGTNRKVGATYRYDAATDRAILDPDRSLARNKVYQVVMGGGVKDMAGNPLDQQPNTAGYQGKIWYFTMAR